MSLLEFRQWVEAAVPLWIPLVVVAAAVVVMLASYVVDRERRKRREDEERKAALWLRAHERERRAGSTLAPKTKDGQLANHWRAGHDAP